MNSSLPKWTKWLIICGVVIAVAAGSLFFIQNKVQKEARLALENIAGQNDIALTIKDVRYSLLQNVLTYEGIEAKVTVQQTPMTYAIDEVSVTNPNRPLALAFAQMKIEDVRGMNPVADAIELRNYGAGPEPAMTIALQRVEGISLNMDVIHEYLKNPAPSQVDTLVALAEALAYKTRVINGAKVVATQDATTVHMTMANMVEKDYADFSIDSSTSNDFVIKIVADQNTATFTLKKMTLERMSVSKNFIHEALKLDPNSENDARELLKGLFSANRPFISSFTLDDMLLVTKDLNVPVKSFRYENSSTNPFAMRLELKGLTLPSAMLFAGVSAPLVSGMPTLSYNASIDGLFPYADPTALTKIALHGSIDKLGSLEIDVDGLVDYSLPDAEAIPDSTRLAAMKVIFTDDGLTARAARLSRGALGIDINKAGPIGLEFLWNSIAAGQRTPHNRALLEQFMNFVQKPGSIDVTFTPPKPLTSDEIEQLQLTPDMLKVSVTNGPKTLNELVQALPAE